MQRIILCFKMILKREKSILTSCTNHSPLDAMHQFHQGISTLKAPERTGWVFVSSPPPLSGSSSLLWLVQLMLLQEGILPRSLVTVLTTMWFSRKEKFAQIQCCLGVHLVAPSPHFSLISLPNVVCILLNYTKVYIDIFGWKYEIERY